MAGRLGDTPEPELKPGSQSFFSTAWPRALHVSPVTLHSPCHTHVVYFGRLTTKAPNIKQNNATDEPVSFGRVLANPKFDEGSRLFFSPRFSPQPTCLVLGLGHNGWPSVRPEAQTHVGNYPLSLGNPPLISSSRGLGPLGPAEASATANSRLPWRALFFGPRLCFLSLEPVDDEEILEAARAVVPGPLGAAPLRNALLLLLRPARPGYEPKRWNDDGCAILLYVYRHIEYIVCSQCKILLVARPGRPTRVDTQ